MIRVNNRDEIRWQEGMTVTQLLQICRFTSPMIVVFVNGEFVHRRSYDIHQINDGADIRVLHLIGGG